MKNETQHTWKSPATPAIPFFARYLERWRKVKTAAKAGVEPKMTLVFVLVACTAPAMAHDDLGVKFKAVTFTDSSTPRFNAPCPLVSGNPIFDRVDQGTVEGKLQGTITACLKFALGLFPQADGFFEIATDDVSWRGSFRAFTAPGLTGGSLATGEFFGDGTDGTKLRGSFSQFQIGDASRGLPDRSLDRAIIIQPHDGD